MSFLSVFKTVGKDLVMVDMFAAPFVSSINPAAGAAMNLIGKLVMKAEVTYQGEKQGTAKAQLVFDEFTALLPMFQSALKDQAGLSLSIDSAAINKLIDATVAQLNAAKAFHDGLKIEHLAAPASGAVGVPGPNA